MSFSSDLKAELNAIKPSDDCSAFVEFFGMLKFRGSMLLKKEQELNRVFFIISTGNPTVARRVHHLLKEIKHASIQTSYTINPYLSNSKSYQITISFIKSKLHIPFLEKGGIFHWNPYDLIRNDSAYFSEFLRGVFFVSGYIVDPKNAYHFEILEKDGSQNIEKIRKIMYNILRVKAGITEHKKGMKLYLKKSNDIISMLELMGSKVQLEKYERIVDQRKVKSNVNRSINFTLANAKKIGQSSASQIDAIMKIKKKSSFSLLEKELWELCELRMNNEDLSLAELGQLLTKPLTKSAVYNRMKKIIKISDELED
ncbi:MAG TPA: DNA-binding protein WhiA [Thermotogota bacterium]|nr:DNA-binding protein WhiA [Thermotogota bacterium]HRW33882.1 DNA-binding protein WhiA [Thermotogota bacterium]